MDTTKGDFFPFRVKFKGKIEKDNKNDDEDKKDNKNDDEDKKDNKNNDEDKKDKNKNYPTVSDTF